MWRAHPERDSNEQGRQGSARPSRRVLVCRVAKAPRAPKRAKPDREPRELAPLLPAPSVLCITALIFHMTDIMRSGEQRREQAHSSMAEPALLLLTTESCIEAHVPSLLSCSFVWYDATRRLNLSRRYCVTCCAECLQLPHSARNLSRRDWSAAVVEHDLSCSNCSTSSTGTQMLPCNVPATRPKCRMSCPRLIRLIH